jgi:hypothetical protein
MKIRNLEQATLQERLERTKIGRSYFVRAITPPELPYTFITEKKFKRERSAGKKFRS